MPRTVVRLSAGRLDLSAAEQALAFMAGANSIFDGDKLLTTPNNDRCVCVCLHVPTQMAQGCCIFCFVLMCMYTLTCVCVPLKE